MIGAQTYNVQLSVDDSFTSKIIDATGVTDLPKLFGTSKQ